MFKIRATSGLKFNLWRGEVRHLAARNLFEFQLLEPTPTSCHWATSFPHHGKYEDALASTKDPDDPGTQATPAAAKATPPPALCPTAATPRASSLDVTTSTRPTRTPSARHRHHHLHAASSTPSPNCPDARAAAASTDHHYVSNATTTATRTCRNPPLPPQLPPSPPPPTSPTPPPPHQPDPPQQATNPVPPNCHQRRRRSPDTRHAATALILAPHQPRPTQPPCPTSSL
ncbi:hypothetical protein EDB83DRAFT_2519590 [Lactarius deliciosus]|nr:hypothetical protein EDB83DRAFT_2519590 [Lactarius deliciosus]